MNPLDAPDKAKPTFEDVTLVIVTLVLSVWTVVIFGLGLWSVARHLRRLL